jgi:hypothetical protein
MVSKIAIIPDFLKNFVVLLAWRKLASGRQQLPRHFFHFFQSRRSHFFTFGPARQHRW